MTLESLPARPYGPQLEDLKQFDIAFRAFSTAVHTALSGRDGHRLNNVNGVPLTDDMREEALLLSRTYHVNYSDAIAFCMYRGFHVNVAEQEQQRASLATGMAVQPVRLSTDNPLRLVLSSAMAVRGHVYTSPGIKAIAAYFPVAQDFLDCTVLLARQIMNNPELMVSDVEFSLNFVDRPDSDRGTYTLNLTTRVPPDSMLRTTFLFRYLADAAKWSFREVATPNRTFEFPVRFGLLMAAPPPSQPAAPALPDAPQRARRRIRLGE